MTTRQTWLAATVVILGSSVLPVMAASPAAAKSCVLAGGSATMITADLAKFMAEAALKNSIKGKGMSPAGAVKLTCTSNFASTYCLARQRACK